MLRRLKARGAEREELLDIYRQQVQSVMELAVPVWHPGLTHAESKQIERVQRTALHIIIGSEYTSYKQALNTLNLKPLSVRREDVCLKFAKQALKSPKFSKWFSKNANHSPTMETRGSKPLLKPIQTRTARYENSTIPYLTELLNNCTWTKYEQMFM